MGKTVYLGIDPGADGGVAVIEEDYDDNAYQTKPKVRLVKLAGATEKAIWNLLSEYGDYSDVLPASAKVYCTLEQIVPRPTHYYDRKSGRHISTILKSTCLIYGSYMLIRGILHGCGIPFEEKLPQTWLKAFNLSTKAGESKTQWKNRLKSKAQQLFPRLPITLAVADALLLAEYGRRLHTKEKETGSV